MFWWSLLLSFFPGLTLCSAESGRPRASLQSVRHNEREISENPGPLPFPVRPSCPSTGQKPGWLHSLPLGIPTSEIFLFRVFRCRFSLFPFRPLFQLTSVKRWPAPLSQAIHQGWNTFALRFSVLPSLCIVPEIEDRLRTFLFAVLCQPVQV